MMRDDQAVAIIAALFDAANRVCLQVYRLNHTEGYDVPSYEDCIESARYMLDKARDPNAIVTK